jgi:hypothetical protein
VLDAAHARIAALEAQLRERDARIERMREAAEVLRCANGMEERSLGALHARAVAAESALAEARAENEGTTDEWERMYAGRECPKCGYHVTMNVEDDLPEVFQRRLASRLAALRAQLAAAEERARKAGEARLMRDGLEVDCAECQRDYGAHTLAAAYERGAREFAEWLDPRLVGDPRLWRDGTRISNIRTPDAWDFCSIKTAVSRFLGTGNAEKKDGGE